MTSIKDKINDLLECRCADRYSVEKYKGEYALYFGKCEHRQGYIILQMTGCNRADILQMIEDKLNQPQPSSVIKEMANEYQDSFDYAYSDDVQHSYRWMMNYANNSGGRP